MENKNIKFVVTKNVKVEKILNRLASGEISRELAILKLDVLALKCFASSPIQKYVISERNKITVAGL